MRGGLPGGRRTRSRRRGSASIGTLSAETVVSDDAGTARTVLASIGNGMVRASANGVEATIAVTGAAPGGTPDPTTTPTPTPTPTPGPGAAPFTVRLIAKPGASGSPTTFSIAASAITQVVWSFGDASAAVTTSAPTTTHVYAAGNYTAGVTVSDALGRTASATTALTVAPAPDAPTTTPSVPALLVSLSCTAAAHLASCNITTHDETGALVLPSQYTFMAWDFGDGHNSSTVSPLAQNAYTQPGVYTITVTAADRTNRRGTASTTLTIP